MNNKQLWVSVSPASEGEDGGWEGEREYMNINERLHVFVLEGLGASEGVPSGCER